MRKYKGSFSIEAAYVMPLVLLCIFIAIEAGISLHEEIKAQIEAQSKHQPVNIVDCMYRREYVRELFGELYED